jgi:hypothetical protein
MSGHKGAVESAGGYRDDLGFNLRSKMEANIARYLGWLVRQKQIARADYEPTDDETGRAEEFWFLDEPRGARSYRPDFKVWNNDGSVYYIEVKGWMDAKSKTKLARMAKYYPDVKIELWGIDKYRAIQKQVGRIIRNWET